LRPDQSWCSLCYADVPQAFDPLTAPIDQVLGHVDVEPRVEAPATVPTHLTVEPAPEVSDPPVEVSDIDVMLSMLAAEHRSMDPATGWADRLGDRSTRVAIMVGGTVVIGAVLFVMLTVFGAIF
jgi:hypothetical protein